MPLEFITAWFPNSRFSANPECVKSKLGWSPTTEDVGECSVPFLVAFAVCVCRDPFDPFDPKDPPLEPRD